MIFKKALRRELSFTTGGVFLVLVTIMITSLVIRILGYAANGAVNPEDALVLIALATCFGAMVQRFRNDCMVC